MQCCVSEDNEITNNFCLVKIQITLEDSSDAAKFTKESSRAGAHLTKLSSMLAFLLKETSQKTPNRKVQVQTNFVLVQVFSYSSHDFYLQLINLRFRWWSRE